MSKIGLDIDGVFASFTAGVVKAGNELWPGRFPEGFEPSDWNYTGYMTKEDWGTVWGKIKATENFWLTLPAYQNNINALTKFLVDNRDQELFYITSRAKVAGWPLTTQTLMWLNHNGVWHRHNTFQILPVAEGTPAEAKAALIKALGIETYIDDYLPTVIELSKIPGHKCYLLDRSWNRENRPNDIRVVHSVQEYFDEIKKAGGL